MGWEASSRRSLPANSLSTTCRFSSTVVGSFRPCRRPAPSMTGDPGSLDKDLLHVRATQQLRQRAVIGDGAEHPLGHVRRITQGGDPIPPVCGANTLSRLVPPIDAPRADPLPDRGCVLPIRSRELRRICAYAKPAPFLSTNPGLLPQNLVRQPVTAPAELSPAPPIPRSKPPRQPAGLREETQSGLTRPPWTGSSNSAFLWEREGGVRLTTK